MNRKYLSRLLAVAVGVGMLLQPVSVYAEEPDVGTEDVIILDEPDDELTVEEITDTLEFEDILMDDSEEPAEGRTPITYILAGSNMYEVLNWGILRDLHYYVYQNEAVKSIKWDSYDRKLRDGTWINYRDQIHWNKGTYIIYGKVTYDTATYETSPDTVVLIDGQQWEVLREEKNCCIIKSPEFEFTASPPPFPERPTHNLEATSDLSDVLVPGGKVQELTFNVTSGEEMTFYDGVWLKKDGNYWKYYTEDTFTPGIYGYNVWVRPEDYHVGQYNLDAMTFTVDGTYWPLLNRGFLDQTVDCMEMQYASVPFEIKEDPSDEGLTGGHWYTKWGATYYETADGIKVTGLQKIDGIDYLFSKNGTLQRNVFYEEDGKTYFFGTNAMKVTGWYSRWLSTYYFDEDGVMQTGFTDIDDNTFYFRDDGRQVISDWVTEGNNTYYMKSNGIMARSETIVKWGKHYVFDENGILVNNEVPINGILDEVLALE